MVNHDSSYSLAFVILILLLTGQKKVEGDTCSKELSSCESTKDCDIRCKGHNNGQGYCDELNTCLCSYDCGPPPQLNSNEPVRKCTGGLGTCSADQCNDACCNKKCAKQYKKGQGIGYCERLGPSIFLCTCKYVC
ncbi:Defensin-like protein 183, partial [Mucuna pruriens]